MTRWPPIVIPLVAFAAVGFVVPICVLVWLLAHYQPPYVLDRALLAQSALRRNAKRDIGNTVLDGHIAAAVLIGIAWFAVTSLLAAFALMRAMRADASMRDRRTASPPDH